MQPCLVPIGSPLGRLEGVTNMVVLEGDFVGRIVMSGPGAGAGPTASAIVGDIVDIARGLTIPAFGRPAATLAAGTAQATPGEAAYYLRVTLVDAPGCWRRSPRRSGRPGSRSTGCGRSSMTGRRRRC